ncbi:MAG: HAD hydrolase family protein [Tetrasphaera sp.]
MLDALHGAGLSIALCSGRNTESLHGLAAERPEIGFLGAGSGSLVQERDGDGWRTIGRRFLEPSTLTWILDQAGAVGMEMWAYTDSQWLVQTVNERVTEESHYVGATATVEPFEGREDIVKLLAFPLCKAHRATLEIIDAQRDLAVVQSYPGYFDIVRVEAAATKGGDVLIERLGLDWSNVIAMGDGENDLGMLSKAGVAMAMAPLRTTLLDPSEPGQQRFDCPDLDAVLHLLAALDTTPEAL